MFEVQRELNSKIEHVLPSSVLIYWTPVSKVVDEGCHPFSNILCENSTTLFAFVSAADDETVNPLGHMKSPNEEIVCVLATL